MGTGVLPIVRGIRSETGEAVGCLHESSYIAGMLRWSAYLAKTLNLENMGENMTPILLGSSCESFILPQLTISGFFQSLFQWHNQVYFFIRFFMTTVIIYISISFRKKVSGEKTVWR